MQVNSRSLEIAPNGRVAFQATTAMCPMNLETAVDRVCQVKTLLLQGFSRFMFNCSAFEVVFAKPLWHKGFSLPLLFNCGF